MNMFDKEATDLCCSTCKGEVFCKERCECWTFAKKGVEFGYRKANEWRYMKDVNCGVTMFEKEAEKYTSNLDECRTKDLMGDAFKDGTEFGYNKCNEQLIKAKEIIKKLYSHVFQGMGFMEINDYNVQKAEAEQFIREEENDRNRKKSN